LLNPSEDNWCDVSRVTDRSDGYMCVYEPSQGHAPDALCISNPAAAEEYACLEPDLTWRIIRGLPFKGTERSSPHLQGDYVYLKLIDGTICADVSKSGMEPIGDYGFQGFCDDGTSYYTRFSSSGTPADGASPFGEGHRRGRTLAGQNRFSNLRSVDPPACRDCLPVRCTPVCGRFDGDFQAGRAGGRGLEFSR
jgi:hypothetical protein